MSLTARRLETMVSNSTALSSSLASSVTVGFSGDIYGGSYDLSSKSDLIINGHGHALTGASFKDSTGYQVTIIAMSVIDCDQIEVSVATLTMENCVISGFSGYIFYVSGPGHLNLNGCAISGNQLSHGALVFLTNPDSTLVLVDSTVTDNVNINGYLFEIDSGSITATRTSFERNTAKTGLFFMASGNFDGEALTMSGNSPSDFHGNTQSLSSCISSCQLGEYGSCSLASGSTKCYVNCECHQCDAGKISRVTGATSEFAYGNAKLCEDCVGTTWSPAGSTNCTSCAEGYYKDESSAAGCSACPDGTACDAGTGTLTELPIAAGYWRISASTTVVHLCPYPKSCAGGAAFEDRGDGYCSDGHAGPLCAVCKAGYFFDPEDKVCTKCEGGGGAAQVASSAPIIILVLICVVLAVSFCCGSGDKSSGVDYGAKYTALLNGLRRINKSVKKSQVEIKALMSFAQM